MSFVGRERDAADGAVDSWIEALAAWDAPIPKKAVRQQLHYTIDVRERYYVPYFQLAAFTVPLLKDGSPGLPQAYELRSLATSNVKYAQPVDRTIGRLATAGGLLSGLSNVSPTILGTLLEVLIETGRLHWRSVNKPALRREVPQHVRIAWRVDADERQRPHLAGHPATVLIGAAPLWYVDTDEFTAGPVDAGIAPQIASLVATSPALTTAQAKRAHISLRRIFTSAAIDGPQATIDPSLLDAEPVPILRLGTSGDLPIAELYFAYGKHTATDEGDVSRDLAFEKNALAQLHADGLTTLSWRPAPEEEGATHLYFPQSQDRQWIRFLGYTVPQFREAGWRVEIDEEFPYTVVESDEEWHGEVREGAPQWLEFDLGIDVEGERVALLPILLEALAESGIGATSDLSELAQQPEPIFGRLPSGAYMALPAARVARVLATLAELFDADAALSESGTLAVPRVRAATLAHLDDALDLHWADSSLRELIDALAAIDPRKLDIPATFKTELRPYQRDGVAWLQMLRAHGFGGVLADDMGLGKTVQVLAHIAIEKAAGRLRAPVMVIAPTSVVPNWRAEIARFVPDLRVVTLTGADRAERFAEIDTCDIALTSYALLPRDAEALLERSWSIAVLDEAQAVKNPRVKAALVATQVRAEQRLALTGTPIENHLEELWSIYAFAVPGLLGERRRFAQIFRTPIEKRNDVLRRRALAARLRPFLLRRSKERVARDLPEKTEIIQRVELAGAQRDLYETIRLAMHKRVRDEVARRGLARSRIVVLDALLKLRQVCCDPRLLKLPAAAGVHESQKLDALLEMLVSLIDDGRRILLFSQFTSMLDLIKPELTKRHLAFVELRGDTRDRETPVQRFQNGEVPLFLISLKAGGTGLNLTAADTVIHYDPWWNPAVERQATDRAHRIGQEQHVFVYKLIAEGTVEERIVELQARKGALAASLFEEAASAPLQLDDTDIESLFA
jgi:superfamily II DNA or RNA helicase